MDSRQITAQLRCLVHRLTVDPLGIRQAFVMATDMLAVFGNERLGSPCLPRLTAGNGNKRERKFKLSSTLDNLYVSYC